MEGTSVYRWLDAAAQLVGLSPSGTSLEHRVTSVAKHALGLQSDGKFSLEQLRAELGIHFGCSGLPRMLASREAGLTIEAVLCVTMSERNADRPRFVHAIMGMSAEDRVDLMQIIKSNMGDLIEEASAEMIDGVGEQQLDESLDDCDTSMATIPVNANDCEKDLVANESGDMLADYQEEEEEEEDGQRMELTQHQQQSQSIMMEDSPGSSSPTEQPQRMSFYGEQQQQPINGSTAWRSGKCRPCGEKDEALKRLSADLETALSQAHETEVRLKGEIAVERNKLVDSELQVIDREEQISRRDQDVAAANKRIAELEALAAKQNNATQELHKLQDEIDVLRPKAAKAEQAEVQIERLRSRLEELIDVRQQLKTEAAAHSETYNRLMACETEIESLHACKKQLDEYRVQYTETLLQVDDLGKRLAQREEELARYAQDNQTLGATSGANLLQTQHLVQELRATAEQLRQAERGSGIGEGMSELNPVLMQELTKLRKDNAEMAGRLDASSLESLARLEKDLADQRCMVSSLQKKLFDTKEALAAALNTIVLLNGRIACLEREQTDTAREAREAAQMNAMEVEAQLMQRVRVEATSRKRLRDSLSLLHAGQAAVTFELSHELHVTSSKLSDTARELAEHKVAKASLEALCGLKTAELDQARVDQSEALARHEALVSDLRKAHRSELDQEGARYRELEADLEEERHKRRKVEREKKFFESEARNNKNQLLSGGGGSGAGVGGGASTVEVDAALREIKTMQAALDAAKAEIASLRAGSSASSSSSSSSSTVAATTAAPVSNSRPLRVKTGNGVGGGVGSSVSGGSGCGIDQGSESSAFSSYFEQTGLVDKRLEQADRERRQLIAQNLEESKEKMELQQRLLKAEKEVASLKRERTKLTLEKERLHSQLSKSGVEVSDVTLLDTENAGPNSPHSASTSATRSLRRRGV